MIDKTCPKLWTILETLGPWGGVLSQPPMAMGLNRWLMSVPGTQAQISNDHSHHYLSKSPQAKQHSQTGRDRGPMISLPRLLICPDVGLTSCHSLQIGPEIMLFTLGVLIWTIAIGYLGLCLGGPIRTWKDHGRNILIFCTPLLLLWSFQVLLGTSRYWHYIVRYI